MALCQQAEEQLPQGGHRALTLPSPTDGLSDQIRGFRQPVEVEVLLAREVVEDRLRRDAGRRRHLGDRDVVEALLQEEARGHIRDQLPSLALLALTKSICV